MDKQIIHIITFLGLVFIALLIGGCVPPDADANVEGDKPLAQVYNKTLYLSDLDGMVPASATPDDSSLIVNAYTNRWIKENLVLYEAERNIPKDLNIDKLVRDYRASLIVHNYEKQVAETELDSVITDAELQAYYEEYKSHFQLESSLNRCRFAKFPKDLPILEQVERLWDSEYDEDREALKAYCRKQAIVYQLNNNKWLTDEDLKEALPRSIIKEMKEGKTLDEEEGEYHYFVSVEEIQSKNSELPLDYIREQATKYILHNRKIDVVDQKKDALFQQATDKGHVKYFD